MKNKYIILLGGLLFLSCKNKTADKPNLAENNPVKVSVVQKNNKYQLLVNNQPFYIKGAGLEQGNIESLAKHHGNSFRTWRVNNSKRTGKQTLDEAQKNGLMVTMGIEVGRERHGFDYNDSIAVKKQLNRIQKEVENLKNHPALLIWGIGNELNLRYTNPKVWDAVNEISKMIHKIDPNHLTTTSLAGISKNEVDLIKQRCPDIDILSFQMYGDLPNLPNLVKKFGWNGPYMVTEWGATGHWEVPKTSWGAPIEENSTVKAANYLKRYQKGIESDTLQCLGSYVFLWGQKQERTPTWYGIFLEDGKETESVDVMEFLWTGSYPKNRTPQIKTFKINDKTAYDNVTLKENQKYEANVISTDFENDSLTYKWELLPESTDLQDGGDHETRPKPIKNSILDKKDGNITFKMQNKGNYRLFVYVYDGNNHAATANIPFQVN
jgi:hypothetical protein